MGSITFWSLILIPLILYGIGKIPDFFDAPDDLWQRIIYRIGSIGGNIMFGIAFFVMARKVNTPVRDYLIIAGMGFTIIGIAFSVMSLQQTFGIAGHSLVLISAYLVTTGLYATATSVSHDVKLRQFIQRAAPKELKLVDKIGSSKGTGGAEKIGSNFKSKISRANLRTMIEGSGIRPSLEDTDVKQYVEQVIREIEAIHPSHSSHSSS